MHAAGCPSSLFDVELADTSAPHINVTPYLPDVSCRLQWRPNASIFLHPRVTREEGLALTAWLFHRSGAGTSPSLPNACVTLGVSCHCAHIGVFPRWPGSIAAFSPSLGNTHYFGSCLFHLLIRQYFAICYLCYTLTFFYPCYWFSLVSLGGIIFHFVSYLLTHFTNFLFGFHNMSPYIYCTCTHPALITSTGLVCITRIIIFI